MGFELGFCLGIGDSAHLVYNVEGNRCDSAVKITNWILAFRTLKVVLEPEKYKINIILSLVKIFNIMFRRKKIFW